jgi:hypothetical protein
MDFLDIVMGGNIGAGDLLLSSYIEIPGLRVREILSQRESRIASPYGLECG